MTRVVLDHGARTDVGLVREVNEDAVLAAPPVFVVADGMGGHEGGDVASALAVEEVGALARHPGDDGVGADAVVAALRRAQERIEEHSARQGGDPARSAGTTVVVAVVTEHEGEPAWLLAHLGDSRAYVAAGGRLARVTRDHSLVQELVDAGSIGADEAAGHPESHVVTRALGGAVRSEPELAVLPLTAGERLVLLTDGVTDLVDDATLADLLAGHDDAQAAADALVAAALEAGGRDNATALVVDVRRVGEP